MRPARWLALGGALLASAVVGLLLGAVPLSPIDVLEGLRAGGDPAVDAIVRDVRLPRVVLAVVVGAALGLSGAALQGALRNPLAEPYLLGVSGGAAVGAVASLALGIRHPGAVSIAAFAGAAIAVVAVLGITRSVGGRGDPRVLLMAGVVLGAFANAAILVILAEVPADTVRGALWWMMGSLSGGGWSEVRWLGVWLLIAGGWLIHSARDIDLLALGGDSAAALGIDPEAVGRRVYLLASFLAAASVAAAGLIGFAALIVPHVARGVVAGGHRPRILASGLLGASLLVLADVVARSARAPTELPLGAVTALVGVPFFFALLKRLAR
jgi:iron complex transport system permease protein